MFGAALEDEVGKMCNRLLRELELLKTITFGAAGYVWSTIHCQRCVKIGDSVGRSCFCRSVSGCDKTH